MNAYRYVADRIVPSREKIVYRGQRLTGDDFLRQVKRLRLNCQMCRGRCIRWIWRY